MSKKAIFPTTEDLTTSLGGEGRELGGLSMGLYEEFREELRRERAQTISEALLGELRYLLEDPGALAPYEEVQLHLGDRSFSLKGRFRIPDGLEEEIREAVLSDLPVYLSYSYRDGVSYHEEVFHRPPGFMTPRERERLEQIASDTDLAVVQALLSLAELYEEAPYEELGRSIREIRRLYLLLASGEGEPGLVEALKSSLEGLDQLAPAYGRVVRSLIRSSRPDLL